MKRLSLILGTLFICASAVVAADREKETSLQAALDRAKEEGKLLFVQYGREACGNCQVLKGYIKDRDVRLSESKFVYADVNCDDPATSKLFREKFKVEGNTLPFVVVAGADGAQLAARTGYGSAREYEDLIRDAERAQKKAQK